MMLLEADDSTSPSSSAAHQFHDIPFIATELCNLLVCVLKHFSPHMRRQTLSVVTAPCRANDRNFYAHHHVYIRCLEYMCSVSPFSNLSVISLACDFFFFFLRNKSETSRWNKNSEVSARKPHLWSAGNPNDTHSQSIRWIGLQSRSKSMAAAATCNPRTYNLQLLLQRKKKNQRNK